MKMTTLQHTDEPRQALTSASQALFEKWGFEILPSSQWRDAEILLDLGPPELSQIKQIRDGAIYIGHAEPFFRADLVAAFIEKPATLIALELVPRSTLAQSMDVLSSQASLAGYAAVLKAADRSAKALPMMSTAAGTIKPANVLVVGAGVAGLQAIATARRLGARVTAYDTRPAAAEQIESLGAYALKMELGETGQSQQGYAKALTPEQLELQQQQLTKAVANADIVVTTAQLFGKSAPIIVTKKMIEQMRSGAVIVDLAVKTGGNVETVESGETISDNGVILIGLEQGAQLVAQDASAVYAQNIANLIDHMRDKESAKLSFDFEDEIINAVTLAHDGQVRDSRIEPIVEQYLSDNRDKA